MARKLEALAASLLTTFALGAVATGPAMAQQGEVTSTGPVTLVGKPTASLNAFTAFGLQIKCPNVVYTGHKYETTPHTFLPNKVSAVTITPHFGLCSAGSFSTTVAMNGCDYALHLEVTTGPPNTYRAKTTVVCPKGQHLEFMMYTSSSHMASNLFCVLKITEKAAGYNGFDVIDLGNGTFRLTGTIEGLTVDRATGPDMTPLLCPTTTIETAQRDVDILFEGKNEAGTVTPVSISHP